MNDRLSALAAAFRGLELRCGDFRLRRPTAGSISLLMDLGNPLFVEDETEDSTGTAAMKGIFEFIWVHAADEDEVLRGCEDHAHVRRESWKLGMAVDFSDLKEFAESFGDLKSRIEAAMVEAGGEGESAGKSPAPTGLPAWSTPSAEPETPPESAGSSGASPSSVPSNTSTPPSSPKEESPDGPTPTPEETSAVIPLSSSSE